MSLSVAFSSEDFRERAAIFDHTVRGALSAPHTSRRPDSQLKTTLARDIRMLRKAYPGLWSHFGKPRKEGVLRLQRG